MIFGCFQILFLCEILVVFFQGLADGLEGKLECATTVFIFFLVTIYLDNVTSMNSPGF